MATDAQPSPAVLRQGGLRSPVDPASRIHGVLFDLDGTLYRQTPLRWLMSAELLTMPLNGVGTAGQKWRALAAYRRAQERLRESSRAESVARAQYAAAAEGSRLSPLEVERLVDEWMQKRPLKYLRLCRMPGVEALLDHLQRAGVRIGILSDYPAQAKLEALGLSGRFSPVLCSTDAEVGALKPNPRGFVRVSEIWGIPPREILMVGDRPEVDAAGARAAGMPCAIVGHTRSGDTPPWYFTVRSLEGLQRVLDHS